jgi:hypothetical protein
MGTNYYLHYPDCSHCGRGDEPIHIGKSSAGWCFQLRLHPNLGIDNLEEWGYRWTRGIIRDEYGSTLSPADMLSVITQRGRFENWDSGWRQGTLSGYTNEADFHARNYSERGPCGLLRTRISERCIAHGSGTWDCIVGEFC